MISLDKWPTTKLIKLRLRNHGSLRLWVVYIGPFTHLSMQLLYAEPGYYWDRSSLAVLLCKLICHPGQLSLLPYARWEIRTGRNALCFPANFGWVLKKLNIRQEKQTTLKNKMALVKTQKHTGSNQELFTYACTYHGSYTTVVHNCAQHSSHNLPS